MKYIKFLLLWLVVWVVSSCHSEPFLNDAYGNFEAQEIIVSSQGNGEIMQFDIVEGQRLEPNVQVGYIDTIQLYLQKQQLKESIKALKAKLPNIAVQIDVLNERLDKAQYEKKRIKRLVESEVTNTKQLDDINAQISIIEKEIVATTSALNTQQRAILAEIGPIDVRVEIVNDLIMKSIISSPIAGSVLTKFAYRGELTGQGRPLFKIADTDTLICRAYITQTQLSEVNIGQKATVLIDDVSGGFKEFEGVVSWVASKAEFTPKVIQTKEQRSNLVYAVKIRVANNGELKIGMPAEVRF